MPQTNSRPRQRAPGGGRKPELADGQHISVRLPAAQIELLDQLALSERSTRSELVRRAVTEMLARP